MGQTVSIVYRDIGVVKSPFAEPLPPEIMRAAQSRLVLEDRFAPAVAAPAGGWPAPAGFSAAGEVNMHGKELIHVAF